MDAAKPQTIRAIASISVISIVAAVLVTGSYEISYERIEENRRARLLNTLHEVLDPASHDNDLTKTRLTVRDPELLGATKPVDVFIATRSNQPVAAIFSSIAPRGYNGPIALLVAISADGSVSGVRVTDHNETPGLGDAVEIEKTDWVLGFEGTTLTSPAAADWTVGQDGGSFDAITGATVTPRAVVNGVRRTLLYFERHKEELFSAAATMGSTDE